MDLLPWKTTTYYNNYHVEWWGFISSLNKASYFFGGVGGNRWQGAPLRFLQIRDIFPTFGSVMNWGTFKNPFDIPLCNIYIYLNINTYMYIYICKYMQYTYIYICIYNIFYNSYISISSFSLFNKTTNYQGHWGHCPSVVFFNRHLMLMHFSGVKSPL